MHIHAVITAHTELYRQADSAWEVEEVQGNEAKRSPKEKFSDHIHKRRLAGKIMELDGLSEVSKTLRKRVAGLQKLKNDSLPRCRIARLKCRKNDIPEVAELCGNLDEVLEQLTDKALQCQASKALLHGQIMRCGIRSCKSLLAVPMDG